MFGSKDMRENKGKDMGEDNKEDTEDEEVTNDTNTSITVESKLSKSLTFIRSQFWRKSTFEDQFDEEIFESMARENSLPIRKASTTSFRQKIKSKFSKRPRIKRESSCELTVVDSVSSLKQNHKRSKKPFFRNGSSSLSSASPTLQSTGNDYPRFEDLVSPETLASFDNNRRARSFSLRHYSLFATKYSSEPSWGTKNLNYMTAHGVRKLKNLFSKDIDDVGRLSPISSQSPPRMINDKIIYKTSANQMIAETGELREIIFSPIDPNNTLNVEIEEWSPFSQLFSNRIVEELDDDDASIASEGNSSTDSDKNSNNE